MIFSDINYLAERARRIEDEQNAERYRMLKEAYQEERAPSETYRRMLAWLGFWMMVLGYRLQKRAAEINLRVLGDGTADESTWARG